MAYPALALGYPIGPGRLVDARAPPTYTAGQERTTLVREGRVVAVLAHAPGLLDDDQLVEEVTAAVRLALENERLQAAVAAVSRSFVRRARASSKPETWNGSGSSATSTTAPSSASSGFRSRYGRCAPASGRSEPLSTARTHPELRLAVAELRELAISPRRSR